MTYDFKSFMFTHGSHDTREEGMCVMEAVAYLAGEPHCDHPKCADEVITELAICINDGTIDDDIRNILLGDLPWRIIGTKSTEEVRLKRLLMLKDWVVFKLLPVCLRNLGHEASAKQLEDLSANPDALDPMLAAIEEIGKRHYTEYAETPGLEDGYIARRGLTDTMSHAEHAARHLLISRLAGLHEDHAMANQQKCLYDLSQAVHSAYLSFDDGDEIPIIEEATDLLDEMIKLTEPQEAGVCAVPNVASA